MLEVNSNRAIYIWHAGLVSIRAIHLARSRLLKYVDRQCLVSAQKVLGLSELRMGLHGHVCMGWASIFQ